MTSRSIQGLQEEERLVGPMVDTLVQKEDEVDSVYSPPEHSEHRMVDRVLDRLVGPSAGR